MDIKLEIINQIYNHLTNCKLKIKYKLKKENQLVYRIEVIDKSKETGKYVYSIEKDIEQ